MSVSDERLVEFLSGDHRPSYREGLCMAQELQLSRDLFHASRVIQDEPGTAKNIKAQQWLAFFTALNSYKAFREKGRTA